jgi:Glycosyl transferase family 2
MSNFESMGAELRRIERGAVAPLVTGNAARSAEPGPQHRTAGLSEPNRVGPLTRRCLLSSGARARRGAGGDARTANKSPDVVVQHLTDLHRRPSRPLSTHSRHAPRVSVVVPTYNEAANLPHVFALLPQDVFEVIVVDGRSTDGTIEVAQALRPDVRIVRQNRRGKGNAMMCGFAEVRGDVVVMLDADGSADPREIPRFVEALVNGADFAKGTRFVEGGGSSDITATRRWGNRMLNRAANMLFGTRYTDLCYGYNAFWTHCLPALELDASGTTTDRKLWGDGFEIETIINTRIAKAGLRIVEIPSYEFERIHGESNLNTWRDGFRVLRALLTERATRPHTPSLHPSHPLEDLIAPPRQQPSIA